jgi:PD-(D/E)XK endonuclease
MRVAGARVQGSGAKPTGKSKSGSGLRSGSGSGSKSTSRSESRSKSKHAGEGASATRGFTSKQWGELAEMMFMVKATLLGFAAAKPYGDSRRYDFIVDVGRRLWRVQVKSSSAKQYGSYMVNLQRNLNGEVVAYDASEIDFVVAYVLPCDAWFVIPVEAIAGRKTAKLCLHGNARSGTLGKYWEAWGLMTWRWPGE